MKLLQKLSFIPILIFLTACPYESPVPISAAEGDIDKALLGRWVAESDISSEYPGEFYQINDLGGRLYEILKNELNSEDSTYRSETFITHISDLSKGGDDYRFLNMKKDGKFYLHRIVLDGDSFVLYEVTENIDEQFSSSEDLKAFVQANMHLSFFYNKDEKTFYRKD